MRRPLIAPPADAAPAAAETTRRKSGVTNLDNPWPQQTESKIDAKYSDLSVKIKIDKNKLDDAVEEQSAVFLEVAEHYAWRVSLRDAAADALARIDAELARAERARLTAAGEKCTDSIISDLLLLHPQHLEAAGKHATTIKDVNKWGALQRAFEQRLRMLQTLANLYASGYWTTSGTLGATRKVRDAQGDAGRNALNEQREQRSR